MISTNYTSQTPSVIQFCEFRLNQDSKNYIEKSFKNIGLSDANVLNNALDPNKCEYNKVICHLWGERNQERRLSWLREKLPELHAPLMFELAIEEFIAKPTVETITSVVFPLLHAARFRVEQDQKCSKDCSVSNGDADIRMFLLYKTVLRNKTNEFLKKHLDTITFENRDVLKKEVTKKVSEIAQKNN